MKGIFPEFLISRSRVILGMPKIYITSRDVRSQEVIRMLASTPGMGAAMPNLAFALIMQSVQQAPSVPQPSTIEQGVHSPTPPLADSYSMQHVDVKA